MNETIKLLLSLSLSGGILAIIILSIKPVIKNRFSKSIQYYIWIVVLLRLVVPFSFEESIMNKVFNSNNTPLATTQGIAIPMDDKSESINNSTVLPNVQKNIAGTAFNGETDHRKYLKDLFNQYVFYLWIIGAIIALVANIIGYIRFAKYLRKTNNLATEEENGILAALLNGRSNVRLVRNRFTTNPMLMGIIRPCIIIPDISLNEKQLKSILLHELAHLKRFDIGVKWLTLIATSIHWFNPLMHFIKREINHACELACDEAVIKGLNSAEKQAYGETLLSIVAEHKYPLGVLQATMCEKKENLKERLVAIMKYNKKSKAMILMSIVLLVAVCGGAILLGACSGKTDQDAIDKNSQEVNGQEVIYKNDKRGFSVNLSESFAKDVEVKDAENIIYFVCKEIQNAFPDAIIGTVGRIEIYDKAGITKASMQEREEAYGLKYLGENEKYYFGWAHATDVQIPPNASEQLKEKYRALETEFNEIIKTFKTHAAGISTDNEIVNFSDRQVEIAGRKLTYNAVNLTSLHEKISPKQVEQMMYRAVAFYKAAFTHDYDTVNRLTNDSLKAELKRWGDNKLQKDDYSAMAIMKLDNYTDVDFPTGIHAPRLHPVESDKYLVMLEVSDDIKVRTYFQTVKEEDPLVSGFSLIIAEKEAVSSN